LKTGTPARVLRSSLDFSAMEEQPGDSEVLPFSFGYKAAGCLDAGPALRRPDVACHITYTNEKTHEIIRKNMHRSPLYGGAIKGIGPRYCPSIEDKVVRFPDRIRHQIFVEPEGLNSEEMYLNGISSSLPEEVQEEFLRTVPGLENVHIVRPGYAVEYDYLEPTQLTLSLMTKKIPGLFVAGQTNGTSGYEEAAGQGLLAGINAALRLKNREPLILSRAEAYIGVLIDDLTTLGTKEPYRMFTSRAEHRLRLRHDTADLRLFEKGRAAGLFDAAAGERFAEKTRQLEEIRELLRNRKVHTADAVQSEPFRPHIGESFHTALKDPSVSMESCLGLDASLAEKPREWLRLVELDIQYEGYIKRQDQVVERFNKMEHIRIPADLNYDRIEGLSKEAREKLKTILPLSVGQASRISGVRPSDVAVLMMHVRA
ncbi:MAG: tRNA uridine-5-carboxymethylaminomethyl(34) synthesis enzyme MnmG, partial [Spirochaetales bacterium]